MDRLFRISDAAIRHSLPMAGLAVIFLGVEALSAVHRGRDRLVLDSMYGGTTVACVYGGERQRPDMAAPIMHGRPASTVALGAWRSALEPYTAPGMPGAASGECACLPECVFMLSWEHQPI